MSIWHTEGGPGIDQVIKEVIEASGVLVRGQRRRSKMNAVEIVREFHALDEAGRVAVLARLQDGTSAVLSASPTCRLADEIANLPDAEREGVRKAIAQDFDASGKLKPTDGLSPDEQVAQNLPSHPFRQHASLPDGIKVDAAGLASEIPRGDDRDLQMLTVPFFGAHPSALPPAVPARDLDTRTVAELRELAAKKDVELTGLTLKADIIAAIEAREWHDPADAKE